MENETNIAYTEVFEILGYMNRKMVKKIPIEIINMFKEKRIKNYMSRIDRNDYFNKNNISQKTLEILLWLDMEYWATDEKRKILIKKYKENEKKLESEKKSTISSNNIFINKDKDVKRVNNNMTVYKDNIFKKIMGIIKEIFEK